MAGREEALRWLAQQLRWEATFEALRAEAAAEDVVVEAERALVEAAGDRSAVSDRHAA
jgi:hypothetical protein